MAKLKDILNGWENYFTGKVSDKAIERAEICAECENIEKGVFEVLMPDYAIKEIQGYKCGVCECPISTAVRSEDYKCPLGKW